VVVIELAEAVARWTTNAFHLPPALDGTGFVGRFVDAVLRYLKDQGQISRVGGADGLSGTRPMTVSLRLLY